MLAPGDAAIEIFATNCRTVAMTYAITGDE
jgi:hypothetical protein